MAKIHRTGHDHQDSFWLVVIAQLINQVNLFIKMYGVKGKLSRKCLKEMGRVFSLYFITKYFVVIFSKSPNVCSQINSGTA